MNRLLQAGIAALVIALLVLLLFLPQEVPPLETAAVDSSPVRPPMPAGTPAPARQAGSDPDPDGALLVAALEALGDSETIEIYERPDAVSGENGTPFSAVVQEGESFLTEGQEIDEGVFAFTKIIPSAGALEDGSDGIRIDTHRMTVDISGNLQTLSNPAMIVVPGLAGGMAISGDDWTFSMTVFAEKLPDGSGFVIRGWETDSKTEDDEPL